MIARLCLTHCKYSLWPKSNNNPMILICPITSFSCFLPHLCVCVCVDLQKTEVVLSECCPLQLCSTSDVFTAMMKRADGGNEEGTEKFCDSFFEWSIVFCSFLHSFFAILAAHPGKHVKLSPVTLHRHSELHVHTECVWNIHFLFTNKQPPDSTNEK